MRDKIIEDIFTTADDTMQGLLNLHKYTSAAIIVASKNQLYENFLKTVLD